MAALSRRCLLENGQNVAGAARVRLVQRPAAYFFFFLAVFFFAVFFAAFFLADFFFAPFFLAAFLAVFFFAAFFFLATAHPPLNKVCGEFHLDGFQLPRGDEAVSPTSSMSLAFLCRPLPIESKTFRPQC